jgi:L-rhamnose mutarotase
MLRKAFRMAVHPDQHAEYARRHQPIWQELEDVLLSHGVLTYSIFLDEATSDLFAYVEVEDEARWDAIAETAVCQRWWRYMRDVMPTHDDSRPISRPLPEVFHIEARSRPSR